jgi:hypothetical protein
MMSEMSMAELVGSRYFISQTGKITSVTEDLPCFRSHLPILLAIPKFNAFSRPCSRNALAPTALAQTSTSHRLSDGLMTWGVPSLDDSASRPPTNKPVTPKNNGSAPTANASAMEKSKPEISSPEMARFDSTKSAAIARTAGGPFSPNRPAQRLTHRGYSPEALTVAVIASTAAGSFEEAARLLKVVGDLSISPRHLQTITQEIGHELATARDQRTENFRKRPLMTPPKQAAPPIPVAAVMADGGRIQTRQPGRGPGVHEPHWRETKTAVLLRMTSVESDVDPHPDLPECFAAARIASHHADTSALEVPFKDPPAQSCVATPAQAGARAPTTPLTGCRTGPKAKDPTHPQCLLRTGVASMSQSQEFGWMLAAAADARGFFSAPRQAFVCDGQLYNWTIQRERFPTFVAITDFLHVSEHLHEGVAAMVKLTGEAPGLGRRWAETCWKGGVDDVLSELGQFLQPRESPDSQQLEADHPLKVLRDLRTYLSNNRDRMDYPRYRRLGLPITSSPVESWIKQLNHRVKGSEKFWDDNQRSEAVLQVRAAWLGEDQELERCLRERPGHAAARPRQQNPTRAAA